MIPLADVAPSSNIIGRHVSISSPTGSDHLKLIAAEITDAGVQHAVAVNLTKTLDITATGQSLYHADMRAALAGINPFTGAGDRVTHFTDLLLWNNGTSSIVFNGDDYVTIAIIYAGRQVFRDFVLPRNRAAKCLCDYSKENFEPVSKTLLMLLLAADAPTNIQPAIMDSMVDSM